MPLSLRLARAALGALAALCLLSACGGGGGGGSSAAPPATSPPPPVSPPPPPPPPAGDPWANVRTRVQQFSEQNVTVLVGDASGVRFTFERGSITANSFIASASAAKFLTGLTLIEMIETGAISLDTRPAQVLPFWTATDARANVTLRQLLSFTSGFNAQTDDAGCWNTAATTLLACAETIYRNGLDTQPGAAYAYGPEHLQIAAAMAERVEGVPFATVFRRRIADPLNLDARFAFVFPSTTNPLPSGGASVSAAGYARILQAVLNRQLVRNRAAHIRDFTTTAQPPTFVLNGLTLQWRYGLGYALECDSSIFQNACGIDPTISSAGAFGFTPWIDFEKNYFAVIAMQNTQGRGAELGVALEQDLQPLIETALGR